MDGSEQHETKNIDDQANALIIPLLINAAQSESPHEVLQRVSEILGAFCEFQKRRKMH